MTMTTKPTASDQTCAECGRSRGHSIGCETGNRIARQYQNGLERKSNKSKAAMLDEIHDCGNCVLCEDHHA